MNQIEIINNNLSVNISIFDKLSKSTGVYNINKSSEKITEIYNNISYVKHITKGKELIVTNQTHNNQLLTLLDNNPSDKQIRYEDSININADAIITNIPNITIGVLTADCVPLLLYSLEGDNIIIVAAHLSSKTAMLNIIDQIIFKLKQIEKDRNINLINNLHAIIGPSIQQKSYEVDLTFYNKIIENEPSINIKEFFIDSKNKNYYLFNLPKFVKFKLSKYNIKNIMYIKEDTYNNSDKYPSYRRNCHNNIYSVTESILSTITINKIYNNKLYAN